MSALTRRQFVHSAGVAALAGGPIAAAAAGAAPGGAAPPASAFDHVNAPVPLPFDTRKLPGLSERLLQSHWENNYGGAVKALNAVRSRLSQALTDNATPPFVYNALKREQQLRSGSVVLHELYFANLGGDGKAPAAVRTGLASSFGSFDTWETEFRKIGQGLGGGSGWVMLGYNRGLNLFENYCLGDHATAPATVTPLLMMDMYEHAYQMDYGAAAAKYIDAFFVNLQWDKVAERLSIVNAAAAHATQAG
jgi:superoxide dismutase, Fe-Mn family